jgi:hypothetical protein
MRKQSFRPPLKLTLQHSKRGGLWRAEAELPPNAEAALQHSQQGGLWSAEAKLPPIAEADKGLRPSPTEWERGWE